MCDLKVRDTVSDDARALIRSVKADLRDWLICTAVRTTSSVESHFVHHSHPNFSNTKKYA